MEKSLKELLIDQKLKTGQKLTDEELALYATIVKKKVAQDVEDRKHKGGR